MTTTDMKELVVIGYEVEIVGLVPVSFTATEDEKPESRLITQHVPIYGESQ